MIKKIGVTLLSSFIFPLALLASGMKAAKIYSYALPFIYQASGVFKLEVNGVKVPVVNYTDKYDYANFSMSAGSAKFVVTLPENAVIETYNVSPKKLEITATKSGNQLVFTLTKAQYLIIKIDRYRELVIAADAEEKDKPRSSGKGIFNVTSAAYNAKSSDKELSTIAIQKAIDDASKYKNGIVYVPAGVYAIGNLNLKSNTSLYLEGGAVLLFTGVKKDYKMTARKASQNRDLTWWIYTDSGAHDVKVYGRGTLDGNGKYATETGKFGNHILATFCTTRFILDGPIIRNSGAWAMIPTRSNNLVFKNFKLFNRFDMGENDGIDVIESQNVLVENAIGIALDDPFSTKTWRQDTDLCRNWPGKPMDQENIVFKDCISWTYCYGFKIGQGVMQNQRNITFKDCVVYDAAAGIGVHHKWGTAAIDNVLFDGIDIERLSYQNDDHRTWCVLLMQNGDKLGSGPINNIRIENVLVRDKGRSPGKIRGLNENTKIRGVSFKNIMMPDLKAAARSLKEMNITDTIHTEGVKIQ